MKGQGAVVDDVFDLATGEHFVFPRYPVQIVLLIKEGDVWQPYFTRNLSVSGISLEMSRSLATGTVLQCMISEHRLYTFEATVVRSDVESCALQVNNPSPELGGAFGRIIAGNQDE